MAAVPSPEEVARQTAHIHEDRRNEVIVSHVVLITFAVTAVSLRFISRRIKSGVHADDWMMLFALLLSAGECTGVLLGAIRYGSAKHAITLADPDAVAKLTIAVQELYNTGISCVKFSTLLMYRRVFPSRRFHIALWALGGFIATYSFIQFLVIIFQCRPVNAAWNVDSVKGKCISLMLELEIMGILNAVTDVITVLLPMPMLWRLNLPWKQKWQVIATFAVAGFVCIVSIWRVPMEAGISLVDASYTDVTGCIWSFAEVSVAIVCACLPTYRPLLRWCYRAIQGQPQTSSSAEEANISANSSGENEKQAHLSLGVMTDPGLGRIFDKTSIRSGSGSDV
ncbi:MAG: hypothetical protein Q9202_006887 [Teloschistes flavicans]